LWATAAGRILKVGTAAVRQMLWTTRRARLFQGMLLLVIELTRAEIHGHIVRWPWQGNSFVTTADGHGGTLITEAAQTASQLVPLTTPHTG
jgi:hypothetical protein